MSDLKAKPAIAADIEGKDLKELATSTGLTQKRLKQIAAGSRITVGEAVKLAPAFDLKPEKLLTRQVKDELKGTVVDDLGSIASAGRSAVSTITGAPKKEVQKEVKKEVKKEPTAKAPTRMPVKSKNGSGRF